MLDKLLVYTGRDFCLYCAWRRLSYTRETCVLVHAAVDICLCVRSPIHGRGLYCKRDLEAGEMVIEYAGEIIRNIICDRREQYYESKVRMAVLVSLCLVLSLSYFTFTYTT